MPRLAYRIEVYYHTRIPGHMVDAIGYYTSRIGGLCHFTHSQIKSSGKLASGAYLLDIRGKEMDTEEFIEFIKKEGTAGKPLKFIVGPPEGFDEATRNMACGMLSLSRMTLQHDVAHLVLLEQIYRALLTLAGVDYNK